MSKEGWVTGCILMQMQMNQYDSLPVPASVSHAKQLNNSCLAPLHLPNTHAS